MLYCRLVSPTVLAISYRQLIITSFGSHVTRSQQTNGVPLIIGVAGMFDKFPLCSLQSCTSSSSPPPKASVLRKNLQVI